MFRSIFLGVLGLAVIGLVAFGIYAYKPAIEPIATDSAQSFDAATVEKGRTLASAGYCVTCHMADGGAPYAGNYPMATEFGTIYSTNITPDIASGIGTWSQAAFRRSMHVPLLQLSC